MTFGMYYRSASVLMSAKTDDKTDDGTGTEDAYLGAEVAMEKRYRPLPRIRVEECGLTVDTTRRRREERRGRKDRWDRQTSKVRGGGPSESHRDENPAGGPRERWWVDAREPSAGQAGSATVVERGFSAEFVDSLRIAKAGGQAVSRCQAVARPTEPRPVPRMRYSTGAPLTRSLGDAVDVQTRRAAGTGAVSSKERVVIKRLAAKRSETLTNQDEFASATGPRQYERFERLHQRASWRGRRCHSLEDTRSRLGAVTRKYKRGGSTRPEDFDFQLTRASADDLVITGSLTDEARRGALAEARGSRGALDGSSVTVHSVDCPMCSLYEPSRVGHVCPPNTPLVQVDPDDGI